MKITNIAVTPVAVPAKIPGSKQKNILSVIVQVETEQGYIGLGESPPLLGVPATCQILNEAAEYLIGKDARHMNLLMKSLYGRHHLDKYRIQLCSWAFSGIELALWDIAAQSSAMPLYELWGGSFRNKVEIQGDITAANPDDITVQASELVGQGFRSIAVTVGEDVEQDVETVAAIRKGIQDPSIKIRVEVNQRWNTGVAINTIKRMEPFGIEYIEQPVLLYNLDALQNVKNSVNVPVLANESSGNMYELLNVLKKNAVDYVKLDSRLDAGYNGARISAGIAEAGGIQCVHCACDQMGISFAGSLHLIVSTPNLSMANDIGRYIYLDDDVIQGGPIARLSPSYYEVPKGPGLGVVLDDKKLNQYQLEYKNLADQ